MDKGKLVEVGRWRPVIPALDTDELAEALDWVDGLSRPGPRIFKVGSQLFTRIGPRAVEEIRARGCGVFLDLKFHDIPNTVARAARAAVRMGVTMFNVHAMGGKGMIRAAVEASMDEAHRAGLSCPAVLAVTVLTSLEEDDLEELGVGGDVMGLVERLARAATQAGVHGLVASAKEVANLRDKLGPGVVLVTPGIRLGPREPGDDQRRVAEPRWAVEQGADFLVMGRGLMEARDPKALLREIEELWWPRGANNEQGPHGR
ncbi:MAG: orotidine-5'-phosphate decarboxylase [Thermodesulfobacteriota bacterium]